MLIMLLINLKSLTKTTLDSNQSFENVGVAFVKGTDERNESFEKINEYQYMKNKSGEKGKGLII